MREGTRTRCSSCRLPAGGQHVNCKDDGDVEKYPMLLEEAGLRSNNGTAAAAAAAAATALSSVATRQRGRARGAWPIQPDTCPRCSWDTRGRAPRPLPRHHGSFGFGCTIDYTRLRKAVVAVPPGRVILDAKLLLQRSVIVPTIICILESLGNNGVKAGARPSEPVSIRLKISCLSLPPLLPFLLSWPRNWMV